MSGKLSNAELKDVSGRALSAAQEDWFRSKGIPCQRNARGDLVVCWKHVHDWVEGKPSVAFSEPDLSCVK